MPRRNNVFFDPKFNEWLFDALINLDASQKALMNRFELNLIKNKTNLKRFVNNENLERKLSLLTKLGIQWNLSFYQTESYFSKMVVDVYKQYNIKGQVVEKIAEMIRQKMFVINSKEVALALSMMSNNCHSEVYTLNPSFLSFSRALKNTKATNFHVKDLMAKSNDNLEHAEVSRGTKDLAKLVYDTVLFEPFICAHFNLQVLDIAILLFLYKTPRNFVSVDTLKKELRTNYKPGSVGVRCSYLFRARRLIEKRPSTEKVNSYTIMQEGILIIGEIINHLAKKVDES